MYFPSDMNFQYFFFNTYPGYFLQALPIALVAGLIYVVCRMKRGRQAPLGETLAASLFVCYLVGLICLTLCISLIGDVYYYMFYHAPSGRNHLWFVFEFDLVPDFFHNFGAENMGNILMFLPFGILYPLFNRDSPWIRTLLVGILTSLVIELLQPIFGRSFDINDIILNGVGVVISTVVFYGIKVIVSRLNLSKR